MRALHKFLCILLLAVLVCEFSCLNVGHSTTPDYFISGTTTWSRSSSPYILTSNVVITNVGVLTIEAGVTVNLGSYQILVGGTMLAVGTSDTKIVFQGSTYSSSQQIVFQSTSRDWNAALGTGCIIDNAIVNSVPIVISDSSPRISGSYFSSSLLPISITRGDPSIESNTIIFGANTNGIDIYSGSPNLNNNIISGQGRNYGINSQGTATITNNGVTNCYTGIYASGRSTIQSNTIVNNVNDGVRSGNNDTSILNNAIGYNNVGVGGTGAIYNNTIINNNSAGIWTAAPDATILYNNIFGNPQNIHLTESLNVEAAYNWWGTTDQQAINQTIWEHKNAGNLGTVNFVPFLTLQNSFAPDVPNGLTIPTAPPAPQPTATPAPTGTITPQPTFSSSTPATQTPYWIDITPTESALPPDDTPVHPLVYVLVALLTVFIGILIIIVVKQQFGVAAKNIEKIDTKKPTEV